MLHEFEKELVYGRKPVLEMLQQSASTQINKIWLSNGFQDKKFKQLIISFAKDKKIPINFVPESRLNNLTINQNHQGIVLSISPINYLSVETLHRSVSTPKIILIAHEIEDPHNLGAMIRTFVAGGGKGIILTGRKSVGISSTVIKTSAGVLFQANFARATNCINVIKELKEKGFWIVGTDVTKNAESIYKVDLPDQIAILVGNEHEGLSNLIKKNCDFLIRVPTSNKVDSLNVSVAFGILLFEFLRQKNLLTVINPIS
ncbi:MAG: 23S rRNA (guanosine(2251)-2'-O)-methyltransferase RlmB [Candidatus Melainabacteria bacterium]|nr:23S rRNA (guanosine(2251)-2'-O)-methyltransferase RlmB [Candidatus Melainabacteria bacterium]